MGRWSHLFLLAVACDLQMEAGDGHPFYHERKAQPMLRCKELAPELELRAKVNKKIEKFLKRRYIGIGRCDPTNISICGGQGRR